MQVAKKNKMNPLEQHILHLTKDFEPAEAKSGSGEVAETPEKVLDTMIGVFPVSDEDQKKMKKELIDIIDASRNFDEIAERVILPLKNGKLPTTKNLRQTVNMMKSYETEVMKFTLSNSEGVSKNIEQVKDNYEGWIDWAMRKGASLLSGIKRWIKTLYNSIKWCVKSWQCYAAVVLAAFTIYCVTYARVPDKITVTEKTNCWKVLGVSWCDEEEIEIDNPDTLGRTLSRNINEIGNELWRMMTTFFQILSKAYNTVIEWIPLPSTESMKQWAWSIVGLNDKPLTQSTQYKMDQIDDIATKSVPVGCGLLGGAWAYGAAATAGAGTAGAAGATGLILSAPFAIPILVGFTAIAGGCALIARPTANIAGSVAKDYFMQDEREAVTPLLTIFQSIVVSKIGMIVASITAFGGIGTYNSQKITQILNSVINASKEAKKRLTQANMKMVTTVFSNGFSFAKDLSKFSSQLDTEVKQAEEGSEKRADLGAEKSTVDTIVKATKEDSLDQYSEDQLQILAGIDESKNLERAGAKRSASKGNVLNKKARRGIQKIRERHNADQNNNEREPTVERTPKSNKNKPRRSRRIQNKRRNKEEDLMTLKLKF